MAITINGTTGVAGVDGSASTPALQGSDTNTGIAFPAADTVAFATGGSERMRINSSGNVGIGTTDSLLFNSVGGTTRLAVCGSSASTDILGNTGASISIINTDTTANNTAGLHFARADTDDTPNYAGASIVAQFPDTQVAGQYPKGLLAFLTSTTANAAPTEKMRIDSSGNVGIGTSSPTARLSIKQAANGTFNGLQFIRSDTSAYSVMYMGGDDALYIQNQANGATIFYTNLAERMRIAASGKILFNTTTQNNNEQVGMVYNSNAGVGFSIKDSNPQNGNTFIEFRNGATLAGTITSNGTTTMTYGSASDYRLKENLSPLTGALATVEQLKPQVGSWKADGSKFVGFVAHELQEVFPDVVVGEKDRIDADGNPLYQMVDTGSASIIATLTAAIQELKADLDSTKAELAALKGIA